MCLSGLAGDLKKAMKDGKPIIIEVCLFMKSVDVNHIVTNFCPFKVLPPSICSFSFLFYYGKDLFQILSLKKLI